MSAPKLTLTLVASALPYVRFRRAIKAGLAAALESHDVATSLAGLSQGEWFEGDERMGWPLVTTGAGHAFIGIYRGPETVHRETPDLYFYLEVPRGSAEQEEVDSRAEEIGAVLQQLNGLGLNVYWGYTPGGTHGLWAVMSLLDALRSGHPEAAISEFVQHAVTSARASGLMALFLGEAFGAIQPGEASENDAR